MTELTLANQAASLQNELKDQIAAFFSQLPEIEAAVSMSVALVSQSKHITVTDPASFVLATEQIQALKSVEESFAELIDPFVDRAFKLHRTLTTIRKSYLEPGQAERDRLKGEREKYAAEHEQAPKVEGLSFRTVWEWILEDRRKLKDEFFIVDEKAIGKLVRSMGKSAETICGTGSIQVMERKISVDR